MFEGSNGYAFAVLPDSRSKVVRVDVRYPVGSAQDPDGKEGLAHLVEHLLFEVAIERNGQPTTIMAELSRLGHYTNAETAPDYTHYEVTAPPEALDDLMKLEVERLLIGCQGISDEMLERERQVVLNEMRQRNGSSGAQLRKSVYSALYGPDHPYSKEATLESVESLTMGDVCSFLASQYQRGRAIVVVSGQVTEAQVKQAAVEYFAQLQPRLKQPYSSYPTKARGSSSSKRIHADVDEPILIAAWELPRMWKLDYRLALLPAAAITSRLNQLAISGRWGHSADWSVIGGQYAPQLLVTVSLESEERLQEAYKALHQAIHHGFNSLHLTHQYGGLLSWERKRAVAVLDDIHRYDSLSSRAKMFADFLQFDPTGGFLIGRLNIMNAATPHRARVAVERHLSFNKARTAVLLPNPSRTQAVSPGQILAGAHGEATYVEVAGEDADKPFELSGPTGLTLDVVRYTASNGMKVILWPHGDLPVARGQLVVSSGAAHDPEGAEGTALMSGFDDIYDDTMVYWYDTLSTEIDLLIAVLAVELRVPGQKVSKERRAYLKERLASRRIALRTRYELDRLRALYGAQHPYARPSMTVPSVDRLNTGAVKKWARKHIVPRNTTLIVAGQFKVSLVRHHIAYRIGELSSGSDSSAVELDPSPATPAWVPGLSDNRSPTVEIDISFLGRPGLDPRYGARLVLAGVIEAKLRKLREELAASYGFSADYLPRRKHGYLRIHGEVDSRRSAEAAAAIQNILDQIYSDPESYRAEFVLARQKTISALLSQASDTRSVAKRLEMMVRFDLPDDYYDHLVRGIAQLTLDDVHQVVRSELGPQRQVFGAFGPKDAVRAAINAARDTAAPSP